MQGTPKQIEFAKNILAQSKKQIEKELKALEGRQGEDIDNARVELNASLRAIANADQWSIPASAIIDSGARLGLSSNDIVAFLENERLTSQEFYDTCFG